MTGRALCLAESVSLCYKESACAHATADYQTHIPPPRPRLIEQLNAGLDHKLTPMRSIGLVIRPGRIWQDDGIHRSSFQFLGLPACPGLKTGPGPVARILRPARLRGPRTAPRARIAAPTPPALRALHVSGRTRFQVSLVAAVVSRIRTGG